MKRGACGLAIIGFLALAGCLPYGSYRDDPEAGDWHARHAQTIHAGSHEWHGKDRFGSSYGRGEGGHERPGNGTGHDGKPGDGSHDGGHHRGL